MKKLLDRLSQKFNLTKSEIKTFIFIIFVFFIGLLAKYANLKIHEIPEKKFSYSFQDSLFKALKEKEIDQRFDQKKKEKLVDSEVELYDFSNQKIVSKKSSDLDSATFSININKADRNSLTKLPGIGVKTADKIIELRKIKVKFSNINELLEVKGIGKKKLKQIKNFITIE